MRERDIERYLAKKVAELGGVAEKFKSPGKPNVPDRIVLWPGRHLRPRYGSNYIPPLVVFVELKQPGKKPTKAQARDHARRRGMGFLVAVLASEAEVDVWADLISKRSS